MARDLPFGFRFFVVCHLELLSHWLLTVSDLDTQITVSVKVPSLTAAAPVALSETEDGPLRPSGLQSFLAHATLAEEDKVCVSTTCLSRLRTTLNLSFNSLAKNDICMRVPV